MSNLKLADKLLKMRVKKKLSKQEVANRLNMDVTTYGRVEKGERDLELDKLKLLPEVLGMKLEEILELLELDRSLVLNKSKDYALSGTASNQNLRSDSQENLNEIKDLYNNLISQKDQLIIQLQEEIKRLLRE